MKWIPIKDKIKPKDLEQVLISFYWKWPDGDIHQAIGFAIYDGENDDFYWDLSEDGTLETRQMALKHEGIENVAVITHWCKLIKLPALNL